MVRSDSSIEEVPTEPPAVNQKSAGKIMEGTSLVFQNNILSEEDHSEAAQFEQGTVNIDLTNEVYGSLRWLNNFNKKSPMICNENQEEFHRLSKNCQWYETEEEKNYVTDSAEVKYIQSITKLETSRETAVDHCLPTSSGDYNVQNILEESKSFKDQFQGEHEQYAYMEEYYKQYLKDINIYFQDVVKQMKYEFDYKLNSYKTEMEDFIERCEAEMAQYYFGLVHKRSNKCPKCDLDEAQNGVEDDAYKKGGSKCEQEEIILELESKLSNMNERNLHLQSVVDNLKENEGNFVRTIRDLNEQINKNAEEYNMKYTEMKLLFDNCFQLQMKELEDSQKIHDQEILDLTKALDKQTQINRRLNSELMEAKQSEMKKPDNLSNNQIDQPEEKIQPLVRKDSEVWFKKALIWDLVTKLKEVKANIKQSTSSECDIKSVEASSEKDLRNKDCVDLPDTFKRTLNEVIEPTQSLHLTVVSKPNVENTNANLLDSCNRMSGKDNYYGVKNAGSLEETKDEKLTHLTNDNSDNGQSSTGARVLKCTLNRLQALHLLSSVRSYNNGLRIINRPAHQLVSDGPSFVDNFSVYDRREQQLLDQTPCSTFPILTGVDHHTAG